MATTVGIVVLTIMGINHIAAENYLRGNAVALRHHLRRGAGSTIEDLAHLSGIPDAQFPRFSRLLYEHHEILLGHLGDGREIDSETTRHFLYDLARIVAGDPLLSDAIVTATAGTK